MSSPKDWYNPRHLIFMVDLSWRELYEKSKEADLQNLGSQIKLATEINTLANNISLSKRYRLLLDYYKELIAQTVDAATGQLKSDQANNYHAFLQVYCELYRKVCQGKKKLLFGISQDAPLWTEGPDWCWQNININVLTPYNQRFFWNCLATLVISLLDLFTGKGLQAEYDRLLVPRSDRFLEEIPTATALQNFNDHISSMLGFAEPVDEDEVLQIQASAMLEQRYKLVENRPVVIRLEDNPSVREVILMLKGSNLLAWLETFRFGDLVHFYNLDNIQKAEGMIDQYVAFARPPKKLKPGSLQAVNALVISIYKDLVTAEEVSKDVRFPIGSKGQSKKGKSEQPETYTTSWQIIPRRFYTNRKTEAYITVERLKLNNEEKAFRQALRRYHGVVGHIRRFRDRPDFSASFERQQLAQGDGILLKKGETYVKPHNKGLSAIEALGEVDLALVPHYLRRGRKG